MRHEPKGLKETIGNHLISAYAITPIEIIFIPVGEESTSYKIETGDNEYIVKFNEDISSQKNIEKTHALFLELAENSFIIPPVKTLQGTTVYEVEDGFISVFPFVKGPLVVEENQDFHDELVEKLVEICSLLQNKTLSIQTHLPAEDFNENYTTTFEEVIKLAKIQTEKRSSQIALQHERKIQELIEGLVKLNAHYKKNKPP
ncbi:MAG TPA: phosphotransferase, partial [Candidatus Woesebacteria bacterium]|nr:phosphotransferase [Candidatus Woesebacteria bacterium]